MSEKKGVEIDYCPKCRGVWLDRGEIDKIIERSVTEQIPEKQPQVVQERNSSSARSEEYKHGGGYQERHYKKKSIWHEIFD